MTTRKKIRILHTSPADENKLALSYAESILQGTNNPSQSKRNRTKK